VPPSGFFEAIYAAYCGVDLCQSLLCRICAMALSVAGSRAFADFMFATEGEHLQRLPKSVVSAWHARDRDAANVPLPLTANTPANWQAGRLFRPSQLPRLLAGISPTEPPPAMATQNQ
jgi:hypothetical protein